jgi:predicted nucleic acid-binding protein
MAADLVAVDTSVWIDALRSGKNAAALHELVMDGRAILPAPALAELVYGARPGADHEATRALIDLTIVETPVEEDFWQAGRIGQSLRGGGTTVGVLDLILSAMCLRGGWLIWSLDAHFPVIARQEKRLRLFVPGEA